MIEKLLAEVSAISKKYALINQKTGAYFNIFDILEKSSDEIAICRLLFELLNPNGSHYQGDAFLRLFVDKVLRLNFNEQDYKTAYVFKEHIAGGRRIDLFIETVNYKIPIEVKIYAGDQNGQCFDYYKQAKDADVYYLTLHGSLPSEASTDGLTPEKVNDDIIGYKGISLISFENDIVNWLNCCLALPETIKIAPIREILFQFKDTLNNLTGNTGDDAEMEIVKTIISSAENMQSALDIAGAISETKTAVMLNLFREFKRLFKSAGHTTYDCDEGTINQYYATRNPDAPYLTVEIKKFPHGLIAVLWIEINTDGDLAYSFGFAEAEENNEISEYKEIEWVKAEYPEIYKAVESAVIKAVDTPGRKTETTLFDNCLYDDKGRRFNFYNFSPSCVVLPSNYIAQAGTMYAMLDGYIRVISELLN